MGVDPFADLRESLRLLRVQSSAAPGVPVSAATTTPAPGSATTSSESSTSVGADISTSTSANISTTITTPQGTGTNKGGQAVTWSAAKRACLLAQLVQGSLEAVPGCTRGVLWARAAQVGFSSLRQGLGLMDSLSAACGAPGRSDAAPGLACAAPGHSGAPPGASLRCTRALVCCVGGVGKGRGAGTE